MPSIGKGEENLIIEDCGLLHDLILAISLARDCSMPPSLKNSKEFGPNIVVYEGQEKSAPKQSVFLNEN